MKGGRPRFEPAVGFGVGLLLALAASAGIAGERMSRGSIVVALVTNALATLAAIVAAVATMRGSHRRATLLVPQLLGAVVGVSVVHFALRHAAIGAFPWLSERPAQLVNDAVAVGGLLALAWAAANALDARLLVVAFVALTLYRATAPMWHVDRAPGGFHATVQQLVVAHLVAVALVLGLFRAALESED